MEFLVCMLLASILTGGRVASDIIHARRGTTPPHLEKAKLKAQHQAHAKQGGRSPYAAGKPRLKDVAAVYWGDALADAIDLHNQRRAKKKTSPAGPQPAGEKKPSLWKQIGQLLARPVGDPKPTDNTTPGPVKPEVDRVPTWECQGCGLDFTGDPTPNRRCVPCTADRDPGAPRKTETGGVVHPAPTGRSTRRNLYDLGPDNCITCGQPGEVVQLDDGRTFIHTNTGNWCPGIESRDSYNARHAPVAGGNWRDGYYHCPVCQETVMRREPGQPVTACRACLRPEPEREFLNYRCPDCQTVRGSKTATQTLVQCCKPCGQARVNAANNSQNNEARPTAAASQETLTAATEGDTMPDTTNSAGSATGDAHDVESATNECNLLDDDLTAINTALDLIDERIDSAGGAAEKIEAFLQSKNVDDAAVGGMSVARDMLSPTHIKALMDAVSAAKVGVQNALAELTRLQELESQLNGADGSVLNGR